MRCSVTPDSCALPTLGYMLVNGNFPQGVTCKTQSSHPSSFLLCQRGVSSINGFFFLTPSYFKLLAACLRC